MPDREEHCRHSEQLYGVRGDDIHAWMDQPSYILGPSHREERHNYRRDLPIVLQIFGAKYGDDIARQIFLDHITLDTKERARGRPNQISTERTHIPHGHIDWGYLVLIGFSTLLFVGLIAYAFNAGFGNPIGLWWNQNWYKVVGAFVFLVSLGIIFLVGLGRSRKSRGNTWRF